MLSRNQVIAALERKKERFLAYDLSRQQERGLLDQLFQNVWSLSAAQIAAQIEQLGVEWPGSLPTAEIDQAERFCIPFAHRWQDHRQARSWAMETLAGRPVIAVDGSQLPSTKDFSIPVGAVQVGWYINEHLPGEGGYVKDLEFDVLAPDELGDEDDDGEQGFPNWRINQERFVRECAKLCELMAEYGHRPQAQKPLCFLDGSLIISFAGQLRPARAAPYLEAVRQLLACSEAHQVPLVGFVDSSYSRDFVSLLNLLSDGGQLPGLSDAYLFGQVLRHWGDRTPLLGCARLDSLSEGGRADFYTDVGFVYVQLTTDRPPARLEIPMWLYEAGLLPDIVDRVRAECVVGGGYPYAVETADAVAVISAQDRQQFYALFQQFAQREGLPLSIARKARSKQARR